MKILTQQELRVILYCMESMDSDFKEGEESTIDFNSAFAKIESSSDLCDENSNVYLIVKWIATLFFQNMGTILAGFIIITLQKSRRKMK